MIVDIAKFFIAENEDILIHVIDWDIQDNHLQAGEGDVTDQA